MSAEQTTVVVAIITHRHGEDISVYSRMEDATADATAYAREWWSEAFEGEPPEDDQACIDAYFDRHEDEFFETRVEVVR